MNGKIFEHFFMSLLQSENDKYLRKKTKTFFHYPNSFFSFSVSIRNLLQFEFHN